MTEPAAREPAAPEPAARESAAQEPAEERGRLHIAPIVLRRIAELAADRVPGTLRHERRLAGIDVGEVGAVARLTQDEAESTVDVMLELTLRYPIKVRSVVDAVRQQVTDDLERMAGQRVRGFSVTISGLRAAVPDATARTQLRRVV